MASSLLSLRSRTTSAIKPATALPTRRLHIQAFRDYASILPSDEPVVILAIQAKHQEYTFRDKKTKSLKDYDRALLGFRYGEALDLVLKRVLPS